PAAILGVAFLEKAGRPPVLAGGERRRARGDHLDALGRFVSARANTVRHARSKVKAVTPPELLMVHAGRRLDGEFNVASKNEGELVLVVITEPIGTGCEPGEQRLQMPADKL